MGLRAGILMGLPCRGSTGSELIRKAMNRVQHLRLGILSNIATLTLIAACNLAAAVDARSAPAPISLEQ
jgi:hypothetical protein